MFENWCEKIILSISITALLYTHSTTAGKYSRISYFITLQIIVLYSYVAPRNIIKGFTWSNETFC